MELNEYFEKYRTEIIGKEIRRNGKKLIYADWAGSSRAYRNIENELIEKIYPIYGNIHTKETIIGQAIEEEYLQAKESIKKQFNVNTNYSLIATGFGMTSAMKKLQEILVANEAGDYYEEKPVVFVSEYEHNSNFISWKENGFICNIIPVDSKGELDYEYFKEKILRYRNNKIKVLSITACSNLTGAIIKIDKIIKIARKEKILVVVDFTALAPYRNLNLDEIDIDAVVFSGHKLLGGVGTSGFLLIKNSIYNCKKPTTIGGGVVEWVNVWGENKYIEAIEGREEAGTPAITQVIKTKMTFDLKNEIGVEKSKKREEAIVKYMFEELTKNEKLKLYNSNIENKIGIILLNHSKKHFSKVVEELSYEYGVQARGGCCCASIYAHKLLNITKEESNFIQKKNVYKEKDKSKGFIRISIHPIMSDDDIMYICDSLKKI